MSNISVSESDIFQAIFANYDKSIRPQKATAVTNVTIYPTLFYLLAVDELAQSIQFSIDFTMTWQDPYLKWTPNSANGFRQQIKVPESFVWQADIALFSSTMRTDLIPYDNRIVVIDYNGTIMKSGPQVVTNPCAVQVLDFPFDTQYCEFILGPWSYTSTELHLINPLVSFAASDEFIGNTEWVFESLSCVFDVDMTYEEGYYEQLVFQVHLKRKSMYYVLVIIVPTFTCTTLCIFGMFIPSDITGWRLEKATLGVSSLLAMAMILETVTGSMPKSSSLPLLGIYVLCEILICAFAMITTCVYSILHERATTREWLVPNYLRKAFLRRTYDRKIRAADANYQTGGRQRDNVLSPYLKRVGDYLNCLISDEKLEIMWERIFDRIDIITLVFFQILNLIVSMVVLI